MNDQTKTASAGDATTALGHFKDWSNYLLVTTVAAVGWVATEQNGREWLLDLAVWSFGISLLFGILTLALVPLVAQQLRSSDPSVYKVRACFTVLRSKKGAYLTQACRPQHILFMVGVVLYCLAVTRGQYLWIGVLVLLAGTLFLARYSTPEDGRDDCTAR